MRTVAWVAVPSSTGRATHRDESSVQPEIFKETPSRVLPPEGIDKERTLWQEDF